MTTTILTAGYVPLVDAAPLIIAKEMGFAEEERLDLQLQSAPSWSTLRDLLAVGQIDAAHMLSPIPVAMALGLGGMKVQLDALSVLSVNGPVVGVSNTVADRMRQAGYGFDFRDATRAGRALIRAAEGTLRIGVPFPFSMHAELLYYWLNALGLPAPQGVDIRTVPPPLMAEAMANGELDAFCVGEPWGSIAVENGSGTLLLPGSAIWGFEPDKVLAVRHDWVEQEDELAGRLLRAVWRAGRWIGDGNHLTTVSEILARPDYLNVSAEVIDRALTGQLVISTLGEERRVERFMEFHEGVANFPWRSQAAWIGSQLATRTGLNRAQSKEAAKAVFRSDLYRRHLRGVSADLPGASEKIEGGVKHVTPAASESGKLYLMPDQFFDGLKFDPSA